MGQKRILVNALSVRLGGGRSYIINLLREIGRDDRGFDFTVLAVADELDGIDCCGVRVEEITLPGPAALRTPLRVLYEQFVLPIRARQHDVLFCAADLVPYLGRTPAVVLRRNLNIYDRRWDDTYRTRMLARLARLGANRARFSVFPSQAAADRIREIVPIEPDRVAVVRYGIDPVAFRPADAEAAPAGRYLFMPASPEPHKNIATAIRALQRLPDLELRVAGESQIYPKHFEELKALAADLGVERRLRFLGHVPYAEMLTLYRGAKALVFPSFQETFGHPLLEAMLAGTPIVASDIPTFRELASDIALFHPVEDAVALAGRIEELDRDPAATAARVARGRVRAAEFSWQRYFDELCEIFERVLGQEQPARIRAAGGA